MTKKYLILLMTLALFALMGCKSTEETINKPAVEQIFDAKTLVGKSQSEVTKLLDEPAYIDKWDRKGYVTVDYGKTTDQGWSRISVLFVNDSAVRITANLNESELLDNGPDNLAYIGITTDTQMKAAGLTWEAYDVDGIYKIKVDPTVYQIKVIFTKEFEAVQ